MAVSIDLTGKRGVVFGVANQRSIAWAISERLSEAGAELAFTYLNERLKEPVAKTIAKLNNPLLLQCDATQDDQVEAVYDHIKNEWKEIVGKPIGQATSPIKIENQKLYIKCKNPTWKTELQYQKKELLIKINQNTKIKDIILI